MVLTIWSTTSKQRVPPCVATIDRDHVVYVCVSCQTYRDLHSGGGRHILTRVCPRRAERDGSISMYATLFPQPLSPIAILDFPAVTNKNDTKEEQV